MTRKFDEELNEWYEERLVCRPNGLVIERYYDDGTVWRNHSLVHTRAIKRS